MGEGEGWGKGRGKGEREGRQGRGEGREVCSDKHSLKNALVKRAARV